MRTPSLSSVAYSPGQVPANADALRQFLTNELQQLSAAVQSLAAGHLDAEHVAPDKPRSGDIRYADGSDWNPGSSEGLYIYFGGAWHVAASVNNFPRAPLTTSAPAFPTEGDIRLADGTGWNPGSGKGVYAYYSAAWHLLG